MKRKKMMMMISENTNKKGKNSILFVLVILFSTILLSIFASLAFYSFYIIQDVKVLEMEVGVEDVVGVTTENDKLYFGTVPPLIDSSANRKATFQNNYDFPVEVSVFFSGEMKDWVTLTEENPVFLPGETGYLYFVLSFGEDLPEYGYYTGTAKVYVKRVLS